MTDEQRLHARINDIDARLAAIELALKPLSNDSYRWSELNTERRELLTLRRVAENRLASKASPQPMPDARRQAFIDHREKESREQIEAFVAKLEAR